MPHTDRYVDMTKLKTLDTHIAEKCAKEVLSSHLSNRELTVVCHKHDVRHFLRFLRDDKQCQFKQLIDITGLDWPERTTRFEVVYHLLSISKNQRIRVKVEVAENDSVASVVDLFPAANWYERETYDMFGIRFENHPDLRRILTDYDFDGFPLRKDFPLEGKVEVYYDSTEKRVAYKPVDLPQEFRHFDRVSSWAGMTGNATLAEEDKPFDAGEFK